MSAIGTAIYFARCGDFVKIGSSDNPTHRVKQITKSGVLHPDGFDATAPVELLLVIPFCRRRDELNMHLLFARHWVEGEWFRWSPEFEHQMRTMQFVTHGARLLDLRRARRSLGIVQGGIKEWRWGRTVTERLTDAQLSAGSSPVALLALVAFVALLAYALVSLWSLAAPVLVVAR